jgi:V/A-type H+-transporting ATPase subunit E
MQNKLQELTDKLYNEGLAKGKQEADNLLQQARSQADEIVAEAKARAASIVEDARRESEEIRTRVEGDVKMASGQAVSALRQQIERIIETKTVGAAVDEALADGKLMGRLLETIAGAFEPSQGQKPLEVILPESMNASLEGFLQQNIDKKLAEGMTFGFGDDIAAGFRVAPKDGGYYLDFTDESFKALLGEYLRPATKKILFG